jgi:membrane protease YdiL (CAAX protease family)
MAEAVPQPLAQPSARWGLAGTLLWGALIALAFVVASALTVVVLIRAGHPDTSPEEFDALFRVAVNDGTILSASTIVTAVVGCLLIAASIRLKKGARFAQYLCLHPVGRREFLRWLALAAAFTLASDLLSYALGRPVVPAFMSDVYATARPAWLLWVALVVAAPVFEEAFFRGFLLAGLQRAAGLQGAIVLTALGWALLHTQYDALHIATIVVFGFMLGWARVRSGSLFVPIGMHALNNLLATVETALL